MYTHIGCQWHSSTGSFTSCFGRSCDKQSKKTVPLPNRFGTSRYSRSGAVSPGEAAARWQLPPAVLRSFPSLPPGGTGPRAAGGRRRLRARGGDGQEGPKAEGVEARPGEPDDRPRRRRGAGGGQRGSWRRTTAQRS
jgi:hypothetical protein